MNYALNVPDHIAVFTDRTRHAFRAGETLSFDDVRVTLLLEDGACRISLSADDTPLRFLYLRWTMPLPEKALFLGDAWERTYGDSQWRTHDPSRCMPWYFLMQHENMTAGFGVKVRPGAFAMWNADRDGVTLWLDLRCGSRGVLLKGRTLEVATVVSAEYGDCNAFAAARRFCTVMCGDPLKPEKPVYGGNNWYYAYGRSSHEAILDDSRYLASLCEGLSNRPYMVIDDGWQVLRNVQPGNSGPWDGGNSLFPDMERLAAEMRGCGVRPGLWFRPLWNQNPSIPREWLLPAPGENREATYLDPSIPEVLEFVQNDIRRFVSWGFELIKHDFTTYDIFGKYAFDARPWLASGKWSFHDTGRTSAEVVKSLYTAILEAAGDALILGCNTIGHLGAGLMHLSRIGDDTSGISWERTRKMGINTLAFRLRQHRTFFDVDADCLGVTGKIPWAQNRQWAELLAQSGTPFLASIKPGIFSASEFEEVKRYFSLASRQEVVAEPLDWMENTIPQKWSFNGREREFRWSMCDDSGSDPDFAVF